jgi:hypothetical protein
LPPPLFCRAALALAASSAEVWWAGFALPMLWDGWGRNAPSRGEVKGEPEWQGPL